MKIYINVRTLMAILLTHFHPPFSSTIIIKRQLSSRIKVSDCRLYSAPDFSLTKGQVSKNKSSTSTLPQVKELILIKYLLDNSLSGGKRPFCVTGRYRPIHLIQSSQNTLKSRVII